MTSVAVTTERARVLITVKTTPSPSEKYGDTVCVAGVRLDRGAPEWIRLYPIAFRWLDGSSQFKVYDVIDIDVSRRHQDTRSESYSPVEASWQFVEHYDPWKRRAEVIEQLPHTTTCDLIRAAAGDHRAPSLGLVKPLEILDLKFEQHRPWTDAEIDKMRRRALRESEALIPSGPIPPVLRNPRLVARYTYRCQAAGCTQHVGRILDWQLTALQAKLGGSDERLRTAIRQKYVDMMFSSKRDSGFFMGNFEDARKRSRFSVLGVYYPSHEETRPPAPTLF